MIKKFDHLFQPDEFYTDLTKIDFGALFQQGYRLIMLDIDNTLARHGSIQADDFARSVIKRVQESQLQCWIISNGGVRRVRQYAASLGLPCVPKANKPSTKSLKRACAACKVKTSEAVMIGDQLLTDVLSAHRAGCHAILVKPRFAKESWNIRLKRILEKFFYHRYQLH